MLLTALFLCFKRLLPSVEALAKASQFTAVPGSCICVCTLSPRVLSTD